MNLEQMERELERLSRESAESRLRHDELEDAVRQELKTIGRQLSRLEERQRSLEERHDGLMHLLLDTQTQLGDQVEQAMGRVRHLEKQWATEESFHNHVERQLDRLVEELDEQRTVARTQEESFDQKNQEWQEQAEAQRIEMETLLTEKHAQQESEWLIRHKELRGVFEESLVEVQMAMSTGVEALAQRAEEDRARHEQTSQRLEQILGHIEETRDHLSRVEQEQIEAVSRKQGLLEQELRSLTEHGAIVMEALASLQQRIEQENEETRQTHAKIAQTMGELARRQQDDRQGVAQVRDEGHTNLQHVQHMLDTVREAAEARDSNLYQELTRLQDELQGAQNAWEREVPVLQGRMKEVVQLLVKAGRVESPAASATDGQTATRTGAPSPAKPIREPSGTSESQPPKHPPAPPGQRKSARRNP